MKRCFCFITVLSLFSWGLYASETIRGRVVDRHQEPLDAVAVILHTADSLFVDALVTDPDGVFAFSVPAGNYRLFLQHLLYENREMEILEKELGDIQLTEKDYTLGEVTVTAERPQVKVEGGALVYDTPRLIRNKPVNNAFDALKELPGILSKGDDIQLMGARSLHVIINGQLTSMSFEQMIDLLKTIPASRIQKTEVMYNAPAKYNVKGALINLVLDQTTETGETFQGEVSTEYRQYHNPMGNVRANLLYANSRLSLDLLVNGSKKKTFDGENTYARHTFRDEIVEIDMTDRSKGRDTKGNMRVGLDYTFTNEDKLSAAYYLDGVKQRKTRTSEGDYYFPGEERDLFTDSETRKKVGSTLQNAKIQYDTHRNLSIGGDFTSYKSPDDMSFLNREDGSLVTDLLNDTKQNINKWLFFANHSFSLADTWEMSYGLNGGFTTSRTRVNYFYNRENGYEFDEEESSSNKQKEYGGNVFGQVSRSFGPFSADISLKLEYFRSDYVSNGKETVLWNDWALFPTVSLSYTFSSKHLLQLNVSSDKNYPSYWAINPQTSPVSSYAVITGNPELKPSREYETQLMYILKQKYIFMAFWEYTPNYIAQLVYPDSEELKSSYRFENFDYQSTFGIGVILPFRIGKILDSRLSVQGVRQQEKKEDFYDLPFNRHTFFNVSSLTNTINISDSKPNLKLTVSGYYISPLIQGLYRISGMYDVSAGLKWTFANDKASLTFQANNIFRSSYPHTLTMNESRHYSRMKMVDNTRYFGVSFAWKFGGYKQKNYDQVDQSRFNK